MQAAKQKAKLKRTPLLRLAAVAVAVAIVGVLGYTVNKQVGNPISAWVTAHNIAAHYNTYHPGEGYVVDPAKYIYADIDSTNEWKQQYVCNVYKTGSQDTGFTAVFQKNEIVQCESATTKSGANTYNRFKNVLNVELAQACVRDTIGLSDSDTMFADFYEPDINRDLFNPAAPTFVQDAPYDRTKLPLKSVACVTRFSMDAAKITDEALAQSLYHLKQACDEATVPFSVYSVQIYTGNGYALVAMDVPAAELATLEQANAYIAALGTGEKAGIASNNYAMAVASRKAEWLYNKSQFEQCVH